MFTLVKQVLLGNVSLSEFLNTMNLVNQSKLKSNRISSNEIAELTGKRHDNVTRDIENQLKTLGLGLLKFEGTYINAQGKRLKCYLLDREQTEILVTGYSIPLRAKVIKRLHELEREDTKHLPSNFAEALELAAKLEREKMEAIATKAEIGARREATAMNTASQAVKKVNKLEVELDRSQEYATVKRMSMLYHGQKFNWRELKAASAEMDLAPVEVFDANYGTVKAYHADVWQAVYALEIPTSN